MSKVRVIVLCTVFEHAKEIRGGGQGKGEVEDDGREGDVRGGRREKRGREEGKEAI